MAADKIALDPDLLTPRDLARAKVALGGKNPYELLGDPETMFPLIIWCLKSRDDPAFTYEQAMDTPFGEFDIAGQENGAGPPPPTASPAANGASSRRGASRTRSTSGKPRDSAASSASAHPNTMR